MRKEKHVSNGRRLRIQFFEFGLRYIDVIGRANLELPENRKLSEPVLSKICTDRMRPSFEQAEAIAKVLGVPASELFNELGVGGTKMNRCCKCGQFVGDQWGATDSGRMSKRADSLLCESCTRKSLLPDEGGQS